LTAYYPFVPNPNSAFEFKPTLDGVVYSVTVTWNLFGQRWFFNIYTQSGVLILSAALIGSPPNYDIDLVEFYFTTSTLIFRESTQQFEVNP
jgi:hypothetical protein